MKIQRDLYRKLLFWKNSPTRKPLLLQGARQVGKTWILKNFGENEFESIAYFNFEEQIGIKQFFEMTKDPERIIEGLSLVNGKPIFAKKTLIILDEIQECNEALNALKYFKEKAPGYTIIGSGSLLGITLSRGRSFPVGQVDFLTLYPLTFSEFLSVAEPKLSAYIESLDKIEQIPDIFFNHLIEKLKVYFISGGMPEAVVSMLGSGDIELVESRLLNIINAYKLDFSKHIDKNDISRITYIWDSLASQLAKENKKFLYRTVRQGARAREYEHALQWLRQAGLIYQVFRLNKPSLPLTAYQDLSAFKIYLLDVGLLRRMANLFPTAIYEGNRLFTEFKGAMSGNFILQSLSPQFEVLPYYWTSGNKAELDFILQYQNEIIPIEVKSDTNIRSKSLTVYSNQYSPPLKIRYSLKNFEYNNGLLNIPLFLVDHTKRIIDLINS